MTASHTVTRRKTGGVKYLDPVPRSDATDLVAKVYAQAAREFRLVPPLTIHSLVGDILAAFWVLTREAYVVGCHNRADREIVAAAVSQTNACPFCVEVHSAMLHATANHALAGELLDARTAQASTHPLAQWALATRIPSAAILTTPPFSAQDAPQILGTAILYHYLNRMVNVFLEPSPSPVRLRSHTMRNLVGRLLGRLIGRRIVGVDTMPGLSLALLPEAPLPTAFAWAQSNAAVAGALARFTVAIEREGQRALAEPVRALTEAVLRDWQGEDPGLSTQWIDDAIVGLSDAADRSAARLTLMTALTSYRVEDGIIDAFIAHHGEPADLIATTAWASFKAAQRIATWIAPSGATGSTG